MRTILGILLAALTSTLPVAAQHACCTPVATSPSMAMFTADPAFRASHELPEPFTLDGAAGTMESVPVKGGKAANIYRVPARTPSNAYVFVFHEWWGLNDHIKQEADRISASLDRAATVIAIDLYDGTVATTREEASTAMSAVKEERCKDIVKAVIGVCGPKARIATVGWCFGGGWSLQASLLAENRAAACVIYYGMPEKNVDVLKRLHAPVLGIFGKQDKWITPDVVAEFEKNMSAASKKLDVKMYDADHAFANPSNPKHEKNFTADAYSATIAFFKAHLLN